MNADTRIPMGVYIGRHGEPGRKDRPVGRFDGRREREAPGGIPAQGRVSAGVEIAHVNVADPLDIPQAGKPPARVRVAANVRASILDWERHRGLINDDQHRVGVVIERLFEMAAGGGGGGGNDSGVRLDPGTRKEMAIIFGIERARSTLSMLDGVREIVGVVDALVLRRVLGDRWTYDAVAAELDRKEKTEPGSERSARYAARRYRDALATLARQWWR